MSFRHLTFSYVMTVFLVLMTQPCVVSHAQTQDELVSGLIRTKVEKFRASGNLQSATFVPSGRMGRELNS